MNYRFMNLWADSSKVQKKQNHNQTIKIQFQFWFRLVSIFYDSNFGSDFTQVDSSLVHETNRPMARATHEWPLPPNKIENSYFEFCFSFPSSLCEACSSTNQRAPCVQRVKKVTNQILDWLHHNCFFFSL